MSKEDDPRPDLTPRDVTILRPRPGVSRRPAPQPGAGAAPSQAPAGSDTTARDGAAREPARDGPAGLAGSAYGQNAPISDPAAGYGAPPAYSPAHVSGGAHADARGASEAAPLGEWLATGTNPLLQAAVPLLVLTGRLRGQISNADVESLRRQAIQEIRGFEERARRAEVPAEDILAARYALCTAIDEAVLNTPWGAQSDWSGHSLLVTFHREAAGGEKFFQILDRVSKEPQRYLALLELLYVCLALGFEGKYRLDDRGAARLAEVRENLYQRIDGLRDSDDNELSARWKGVEDRRNAVLRFVPLWVVAAACAVLLVGAYIYFDSRLDRLADPVSASLSRIGLEAFDSKAPAANVPTSGLRELLAPQIAGGRISVEESGARTLITLTATDLFASGSANVNASYTSLIHDIGSALNKVPGRILVIGHTDDQPLRSLRFKDNYELSRARALQVADLIRGEVTDGSRIEAAGKGALEPRYQPADEPANRARNRRVEIIHLRGG